jgi:hypothetical protein
VVSQVDAHPISMPDRVPTVTSAVPSVCEAFCHTFEG